MDWYAIRQTLTPLEREPAADEAAVLLLTSDELAHLLEPSELAEVLVHTPGARDARVCKAEVRSNYLSGTLSLPGARQRRRTDRLRLSCYARASGAGG